MPLSARWPLANARTGRRPARPSAEAVRPLAGRAPVNVPAPRPPRSGRGRRRWPRQLPAAGADRPGAWRRPVARDRWRRRRRAGARAPGTLRAGVLVPWTPWGFPRPRACDEGSAQSLCSIPLRRPLRQRGPRPAAEEVVPTAVATRAPSAGPPASAPARAAVHHGGPRRPTDAPRRSPRVQSVDGGLPRPGYAHALASDSPGPRAAGAPATPDACVRPAPARRARPASPKARAPWAHAPWSRPASPRAAVIDRGPWRHCPQSPAARSQATLESLGRHPGLQGSCGDPTCHRVSCDARPSPVQRRAVAGPYRRVYGRQTRSEPTIAMVGSDHRDFPAASYSPRGSPPKYHRRWRA